MDEKEPYQLELIPASDNKATPFEVKRYESPFHSPKRQEAVFDMIMAENAFFTLSKKETEGFDYVSPDGGFRVRAKVLNKNLGLPTINDGEILAYIGALIRDQRLDGEIGEDGSFVPRRYFDIQIKAFLDWAEREPGGQAYRDFMKGVERLSGTEYEITEQIDEKKYNTSRIPEFEKGDKLRVVESERLVKGHKRLEVVKSNGRIVVTAVRIELCDWLSRNFADKRSSLLFSRDHFKNATPLLKQVSSIIRKQMGNKDSHVISYEKLRIRCRSTQSTPQFKKHLKKQINEHGLINLAVDLGPPNSKNITFLRDDAKKIEKLE